MKRRDLLVLTAGALGAPGLARSGHAADDKNVLPVERFQPRSMLHVHESHVPRAAYPVIDFHTHITHAGGLQGPGNIRFAASAEECLKVMDSKNIRTMVDLTGGYGANLQQAIDKLQTAHPGRFIVFTEPAWSKAADADYSRVQADLNSRCAQTRSQGPEGLEDVGLVSAREGHNG